ncbi:hypothetical protein NDU88_007134 [Pleurodeles waltl]|uniref:Uncharacterized protein n=1 Tax=Pleurodeles waltl TaxID=8319 RepID=A0AAV7UP10_PLEWA|nr:hypothetical protein NDU88_007134 [Pleurodeles waltl]
MVDPIEWWDMYSETCVRIQEDYEYQRYGGTWSPDRFLAINRKNGDYATRLTRHEVGVSGPPPYISGEVSRFKDPKVASNLKDLSG